MLETLSDPKYDNVSPAAWAELQETMGELGVIIPPRRPPTPVEQKPYVEQKCVALYPNSGLLLSFSHVFPLIIVDLVVLPQSDQWLSSSFTFASSRFPSRSQKRLCSGI